MNLKRRKRKKNECYRHREIVYESALDRLQQGKTTPEYVRQRFLKLKQVS